jgi:hypothetical protein
MLIYATSWVPSLGTVKLLRLNVFIVTEMTEKHFDIHEILGSDSCEYEDCCIMGYDVVG